MVGMTAAHNAARKAVMPVATPALPKMTWKCRAGGRVGPGVRRGLRVRGHRAALRLQRLRRHREVHRPQVTAQDEDASYDYANNTCAANAVCGHYTQVVWRDSTELGCGMANCTVNNPFGGSGPWQLWVCNYNPPGNYVGMKPY